MNNTNETYSKVSLVEKTDKFLKNFLQSINIPLMNTEVYSSGKDFFICQESKRFGKFVFGEESNIVFYERYQINKDVIPYSGEVVFQTVYGVGTGLFASSIFAKDLIVNQMFDIADSINKHQLHWESFSEYNSIF